MNVNEYGSWADERERTKEETIERLTRERDDALCLAEKRGKVIQWQLEKRIPFLKKQRDEARKAVAKLLELYSSGNMTVQEEANFRRIVEGK